jgi:hypothetical protein
LWRDVLQRLAKLRFAEFWLIQRTRLTDNLYDRSLRADFG